MEGKGKTPATATPVVNTDASGLIPAPPTTGYNEEREQHIPEDPGDQWLPKILEDKSYVLLPLNLCYSGIHMHLYIYIYIMRLFI